MLIFAHIFAGAVLGLLLAQVIGDRRFVPVCIAGSILPDLIDKPLGLIVFPQALDNARTFSHTLLIVGILSALAVIAWRSRRTYLLLGFTGAILLHQVLDEMWHNTVTWFFPWFGIFRPVHEVNFFGSYFWLEITSIPEWIFLIATLLLLWVVYSDNLPAALTASIDEWKPPLLKGVLVLLSIISIFSFACAIMNWKNLIAPYNDPENNLMLGLVALAGCGILIKIVGMKLPVISGEF